MDLRAQGSELIQSIYENPDDTEFQLKYAAWLKTAAKELAKTPAEKTGMEAQAELIRFHCTLERKNIDPHDLAEKYPDLDEVRKKYQQAMIGVLGRDIARIVTADPSRISFEGGFILDLNLNNTPISGLPENFYVRGNLFLNSTEMVATPADLRVGNSLYLKNAKSFSTVTEGTQIDNSLYLDGSGITQWPRIQLKGNLVVKNTLLDSAPLDKLPDGLRVGGYITTRHSRRTGARPSNPPKDARDTASESRGNNELPKTTQAVLKEEPSEFDLELDPDQLDASALKEEPSEFDLELDPDQLDASALKEEPSEFDLELDPDQLDASALKEEPSEFDLELDPDQLDASARGPADLAAKEARAKGRELARGDLLDWLDFDKVTPGSGVDAKVLSDDTYVGGTGIEAAELSPTSTKFGGQPISAVWRGGVKTEERIPLEKTTEFCQQEFNRMGLPGFVSNLSAAAESLPAQLKDVLAARPSDDVRLFGSKREGGRMGFRVYGVTAIDGLSASSQYQVAYDNSKNCVEIVFKKPHEAIALYQEISRNLALAKGNAERGKG